MAETVTPSVRGAQRIRVVTLLAAAGVATGAGSAVLLAAVWETIDLPAASAAVAVVVAAVAVALDVLGRPRPLDIGRQVPQLWGRLFSPETVAVLYGARLGVGPLTILTSWLWWAAIAIAITVGPVEAALAGAAFHLARVATMLTVTAGAQACMPTRIASVRRRERRVADVSVAVVGALTIAVALAGCSGDDDGAAAAPATTTTSAVTTTTTTRPPTPTPETRALDALLPDDSLPGFTRVPDGARGAGPLDLDAAARAERDTEAERAVLTTRGFRQGAARVWTGPDDDTVYVAVYEFGDAAGAAAYLADGRETLEARQVRQFPVDVAAPSVFGFTQVDETVDGAFVGHAAAFTSGNRYALVIVGGDVTRRTPDEVRDLARRMWERLSPSLPSTGG